MKPVAVLCLSVFALAASAPSSFADTLRGSDVTGVLHVEGDTTNDFFSGSNVVGPGIEFSGVEEVDGDLCAYTANLGNARIAIRNECAALASSASDAAADRAGSKPTFTMTFTDAALAGDTIASIRNGLDLTFSLTGDQLTFTFDDTDPTTNRSTFSVLPAAVTPEPASWQLLGLGLLGAAAVACTSKRRTLMH